MNRRDSLIRAHQVSALVIRSYLDNAETLADDQADADRVEKALINLADRHDAAVQRMISGFNPAGGAS